MVTESHDRGSNLLAVGIALLVAFGSIAAGVSLGVETAVAANEGTGVVEGTPHLNASAPEARFDPGEDGTLSVTIANDATIQDNNDTHPTEARERAGEARSVEVSVSDTKDAPISVRTGTRNVGTIQDGGRTSTTFDIVVDEDAAAGTYEVEITTEYRHAKRVEYEYNNYTDSYEYNETVVNRTETDTITVVVEPEAQFDVTAIDHDVPLGGEGTVSVEVTNTGDENVSESTVSLTSSDSDFYFGSGTATSEAEVGTWEAGETKRLRFRAGTVEAAVNRSYPIDVAVSFTDSDDNQQRETEGTGIRPHERTRFEVVAVDHDVPRDGEGTMAVEISHTAGKPIEDVSVTASTTESEVYLGSEGSRSATSSVGAWDPNENRRITFRVGTTENAVDRAYPIDLEFEYTDADDNENSRTEYVEFVPHEGDHFDVQSVEHDVPRDGVGTVTVTLEHTANKSITDVSLTASTPESEVYLGSESSRSATALVGEWGPNETRQVTFRVGTTENAVRRNYPLELSFDYTDAADNDNQDTEYVEFRPQGQPHFTVESVDSNVPIAGTGLVEITLRNDGPTNATEATLSISSAADAVFFGSGSTSEPIEAGGFVVEQPRTGTPNSETFIGDWPVGETKTVYFRAGFDENAIVREYPAELTVEYDNEAGNDMPEQSRSIGVRPLPNQTFEFDLVESELYVGEEGTFVGRVTNVGNRTAEGLVVTAENQRQNVNFYTNRYAIGTLEPGESATFQYRVGVTEETEHGPRLFEVSARYRDPQGNVRHTDTQDLPVDIHPERDAFAVDTERVTYSPGESGELVVTVTNRRNETLSDVQAKLFTDDPLDSDDDSAFIPELEPGESATITLDVSVGETAKEKTYSASMDFRFDDARGDSELSDTYRVPVTVERSEGGNDLVPFLGIVAVFAGAAVVGWRFEALDRCREWYRDRFGN